MKKAYIIPLVILLLFVSVVPSFAAPALLTADRATFPNYEGSDKVCIYATEGYSVNMKVPSLSNSTFTLSYNYNFTVPPDVSVLFGQASYSVFYISVNGSPFEQVVFNQAYTFSANDTVCLCYWASTVPFYHVSSSSSFDITYRTLNATYPDITFSDLISFYYPAFTQQNARISLDSGYYDLNDIPSYVSSNIVNPGNLVVSKWSGLDPFLDLYSHTFECWSYLGNIGSTYNLPFIFFVAVLSILILIFLTVFLIKRFTGGNT